MLIRVVFLSLVCVTGYAQQRTNIIYIMSDDHDADAISAYNKTFINTPNLDRLAKEGMRFTRAFVANSICSPARATLLTGQHSHLNGIKDNRTPFDSSRITIPKILRERGYETALIGKWHLHSLPSGFDYWKIYPGQGIYYSPRLIHMNNDTVRYKGYSTEILTDEAINWLNKGRTKNKPFFLMFHHKAPHRNFVPHPKYLEKFSKRIFPEPPTLYETGSNKGSAHRIQKMSILEDMRLCTDLKIDPEYISDIPHLKPDSADVRAYHIFMNGIPEDLRQQLKTIYAERGKILREQKPSGSQLLKLKYQWYMQDFLSCVASVDESIGKLLDYLDSSGLASNTAVIYTADQGFYLGENGWFDKRFMYDVSMQTPLMIRWKGKIKPGSVNNALVQNLDFAPTILSMAGIKPPGFMQGLSLMPLLTGQQQRLPRNELYYHYYEYPFDHAVIPHLGIRENRYKLIYYYTVDEWEFYDLQNDPREQKNLVSSTAHRKEIERMKKRLVEVRKTYKDNEPAGILK